MRCHGNGTADIRFIASCVIAPAVAVPVVAFDLQSPVHVAIAELADRGGKLPPYRVEGVLYHFGFVDSSEARNNSTQKYDKIMQY